MLVTKKMTVDLARKTILGTVDAVQGDSAIALELTLLCDGAPWPVPADASVVVRYCQGTQGGTYDTLADGTAAWQAQSNMLTVRIAPEVCGAPGKTDFQVTILKGNSQISTFRLTVCVQGVVSGSDKPGKYTNLAQWLLANGSDGQVVVNLELEDLRIGVDGTEYESAGAAVRAQVEKLQTDKADKTELSALQTYVDKVAQTPCACEEEIIDLTGKIIQGYYLPWTGKQSALNGERCTDFIPVKGGYRIWMKNINLEGSRSVCVYDANKNLLRVLIYNTLETELTLTLPVDAVYLRTTLHKKLAPDFRYPDPLGSRLQIVDDRISNRVTSIDNRVIREVEDISSLARSIDLTGKIIQGYYLPWSGKPDDLDGERCTDFIPVKGGYDIHFKNVNLTGSRSVCVYDANQNFLRCLRYNSEETEFTLTMPLDASYVRASIQPTGMPEIRYAGIVDSAVALLGRQIEAKGYQTQAQVQTLIDNAISALPVYNGEAEDV